MTLEDADVTFPSQPTTNQTYRAQHLSMVLGGNKR